MKIDFEINVYKNVDRQRRLSVRWGRTSHTLRRRFWYEDSRSDPNRKGVRTTARKSTPLTEERGGLYASSYTRLPFNLCHIKTVQRKTYAEATGIGDLDLDWIIDELDSSFNRLAIASMTYHMNYAVTNCDPETREKFEDLIKRLSVTSPPRMPQEDVEFFDKFMSAGHATTQEEKDLYEKLTEAQHQREKAFREETRQARKDFIDILPWLWS